VNGAMASAALQQQLMNAQLNNYLHHLELQVRIVFIVNIDVKYWASCKLPLHGRSTGN